ncbi:MAG: M13 family metallopeptidase [Betaproteobacteria bacterium]
MPRHLVAFAFVSLPLAVALAAARPAISGPGAVGSAAAAQRAPASQSGLMLDALDRTADPCTDFYQFACGGWVADNPIPPDRSSWGSFDELQDRNNEVLHQILEAAAPGTDPDTKQIGDYYASCMDVPAIDRKGAAPLQPDLDRIAAFASPADLPALVARLHTIGVNAFFGFGAEADFKEANMVRAIAGQGGLGLPDRDYYFRDDAKSVELRKDYVAHVTKMLGMLGDAPEAAAAGAAAVMRVETALARAALGAVARRNLEAMYHRMTPAELQALTPGFDWSKYFAAIGAPPIDAINVTEPEFFKAFGQVVSATPLPDLRTYLRWHLVHANAQILSTPFVDENFRFYGTELTGVKEQRPRWKRCVQYTDSDLGEALGKAFVARTFGPNAKADTLEMVHELESALQQDITNLDWMTEATKKQALVKLHAITNKIGYPDRWRDYSTLSIVRGDALGNSARANAFEFRRQLNKIGKPLDKSEWGMTPPTVNAYYNPLENNVNFPAGILQPPFYSASRDAALNFGGAGAVIGHELTHGFDDQGRLFDADGNLKDWWTPEDAKAFQDRTSCLVNEYSGFTATDDVKVNGKLTLGENTADNGGVRIALMAYLASKAGQQAKAEDGFTPEQRVFLGWGQIWCQNVRPEAARLLAQTNPHAPGRYRVNGVVSNMPEFQKAFSCKADAPMVRHPACRVW